MDELLNYLMKQWPLLVIVGFGVYFFANLRNGQKNAFKQLDVFSKIAAEHWEHIEGRMDAIEKKVLDHIASDTPHISCAGHQVALMDITSRLDRVQKGIVRLESWFVCMATGKKIPTPTEEL